MSHIRMRQKAPCGLSCGDAFGWNGLVSNAKLLITSSIDKRVPASAPALTLNASLLWWQWKWLDRLRNFLTALEAGDNGVIRNLSQCMQGGLVDAGRN